MRTTQFGVWIAIAGLYLWLPAFAHAQTVQLPSFRQFHYSGSVMAPDRGSASLGGVSRSYASRAARRGSGVARSAGGSRGGASVHVTIIDHDAIDRRLRGLPPESNRTPPIGAHVAAASKPKVQAIDPDAEGKALVRYARRLYIDGRHVSAFDAYRLAIPALSPKLASLAKAELERLFAAEQRPPEQRPPSRVANRPTAPDRPLLRDDRRP